MKESVATSWLELQCQMIPGVVRGLVAMPADEDSELRPIACWPPDQTPSSGLMSVGKLALNRREAVAAGGESQGSKVKTVTLEVACPIERNAKVVGVVAVEVKSDPAQQQAIIRVLRWGALFLELMLGSQRPAPENRPTSALEIVSKALGQPRSRAAATALAGELAHSLSCDRVSVGLGSEGGAIRVLALSDTATFDSRTNLVRHIEAAMDEAVAQPGATSYPATAAGSALVPPAHERLALANGSGAILTVPMPGADGACGAITLERMTGSPLDKGAVQTAESVAALMGPILELKREQEKPALERLRRDLAGLLAPREWRRRVLLVMVLAAAAFLFFATSEFRVTAPATVEGSVHRAVVAPYNAYVAAASARAGEAVKKGQMLAELDDRDLQLELRKRNGERDGLVKEHRRALAGLDRAEARVLAARIGQVEAQIALIEEQVARAKLPAPFDGVVVRGDLSRSLGKPVERGEILFEVAPLDEYRVALEVEDRDIAEVRVGQRGLLTLSAVPGEPLKFQVSNVSSISGREEGSPTFRVEALLENPPDYLRPGMQGVAKIVVGERRLIRNWLRPLEVRARLWLWSWLP